jgi:hypothetical protein
MAIKFSLFLIFPLLALFAGALSVFTACAGMVPKEVPSVHAPSPQETIYNGQSQPVSFSYEMQEVPELVYYSSEDDRKNDQRGSGDAPVQAGLYYVRIRIPPENGPGLPEDVFVDYRILKSPVKIRAEPVQEAVYNGDPKRVRAGAEPPVPLSYSYYPNAGLRDAAAKEAEDVPQSGLSGAGALSRGGVPSAVFRGFRRVERAPIEQGTYYVRVYFPGDENHEAASVNVEFTILPPPSRK